MYTHMCTYAYGYIGVSVQECWPTYAYVYEFVCVSVICLLVFPELQWCLYKYIGSICGMYVISCRYVCNC